MGAKMRLITQRVEENSPHCLFLVRWEQEDGRIRIPEEREIEYPYPGPFLAAGKEYNSWRELSCLQGSWEKYLDRYGRKVAVLFEGFPCFDIYDRIHENRCYRWFFLREGGSLTRVYCQDEGRIVRVTQDVARLTRKEWALLKQVQWDC